MTGIRAVLFDAYGTLFRLEAIEAACHVALTTAVNDPPDSAAFTTLWRAKQLEYSLHRSLMGDDHYVDFAAVTAEALDFTFARFDLAFSPDRRQALLAVWETPGADPDASAVLRSLSPLPCAILSNGAPAMLERAVAAAGLTDGLDAILSADTVRVYKPHPAAYALGTARFGLPANEIAFVTANSWDAAGAGAFGYRVCWINRAGSPADRHGPPPESIVAALANVPAVIAAGSR